MIKKINKCFRGTDGVTKWKKEAPECENKVNIYKFKDNILIYYEELIQSNEKNVW